MSAKKQSQRAPKTSQIERTKELVLRTTSDLLREKGYRELSIEKVVDRSGVARSTIYRHWDNRAELAIAAFDRALGPGPETPDTGHIRDDLLNVYERFPKILNRSIWGSVLPSIIEASQNDPLFEGLLATIVNERRSRVRNLFIIAIERGQIKPGTNIDWAIDTLEGISYFRRLLSGEKLDDPGMVDWLVDSVLSQILISKE